MHTVIVRLDLDRYTLTQLANLVTDGVLTISEVQESHAFKTLDDLTQLRWVRAVQRTRDSQAPQPNLGRVL
jgi:hypothetical protein